MNQTVLSASYLISEERGHGLVFFVVGQFYPFLRPTTNCAQVRACFSSPPASKSPRE